MILKFDLYQTVALAVCVYFFGTFVKSKLQVLTKYCIPAPVVGGVIFAVLALILRLTNILSFEFDAILQNVFMTVFFTSVGFTASLKVLKKGLLQVVLLLIVAVVLVCLQDVLGAGLAALFGLNPLLGLTTGSISMVGGHGTSASFGPLLEGMGVTGANAMALASATFGLVAGGMIGGPIAKKLIEKNNLKSNPEEIVGMLDAHEQIHALTVNGSLKAISILFIVMGLGSLISKPLIEAGLTFPSYIGAMFVGAITRNIADWKKADMPYKEIDTFGNVCLTLFISMALMTLKLWELLELALPMVIMLLAQTVLMALYAYFVTFNVCGKDYDAAVLTTAICGFGMGATANAIANMDAVTSKYGYSAKAYFVVPIVGSMFIDFINTGVILAFINFLG